MKRDLKTSPKSEDSDQPAMRRLISVFPVHVNNLCGDMNIFHVRADEQTDQRFCLVIP